jgi:hypothetical protein
MQYSASPWLDIHSAGHNEKHQNIAHPNRLHPKIPQPNNFPPNHKNRQDILKQHDPNENINNNIERLLLLLRHVGLKQGHVYHEEQEEGNVDDFVRTRIFERGENLGQGVVGNGLFL